MQQSDHFDGRRFFNPEAATRTRLWQMLRWLATRRKQRWPKWVEDEPASGPPDAVGAGELALTFVNHSTFLIQTDVLNVLTDPVWSERVSPLRWAGPRRVRAPGVAFEKLPPIQLVLVSHSHYDHMDLATLRRLERRFRPLFLTGLGNARLLRSRGLLRVEELDWWQSFRTVSGVEVTMTPAQHFSRRGLLDTNRSLWGGFLLRDERRKVYFAGDSGYGPHFAEVGRRFGGVDVALLPIGAYEPRWFMRPHHVNPEEAVRVHLDLRSRQSVAMHFGTFQLTDEPIDEPVRALGDALARHCVPERDFRVPRFGETILFAPARAYGRPR
ncbi:MAG TPA: MBL fold metallo-hydrolase [Gemmataceae bacterium]|nr:MBL fold metallo-hydrolase [Gemmataceae bacterium]